MHKVYLSLGSNVDARNNIRSAIKTLRDHYPSLRCSQIYESNAVGFDGDNFLNLVVEINSEQSLDEMSKTMREIECQHGRVRNENKFSNRSLDIDILTFDDWVGTFGNIVLPRDEITKYAFVLRPLAELAGKQHHPQLKLSYEQLWREFNQKTQVLWPAEI